MLCIALNCMPLLSAARSVWVLYLSRLCCVQCNGTKEQEAEEDQGLQSRKCWSDLIYTSSCNHCLLFAAHATPVHTFTLTVPLTAFNCVEIYELLSSNSFTPSVCGSPVAERKFPPHATSSPDPPETAASFWNREWEQIKHIFCSNLLLPIVYYATSSVIQRCLQRGLKPLSCTSW